MKKKNSCFTISIGELIDRLSIANIKVWKAEEAINEAKKIRHVKERKEKIYYYSMMIRDVNTERANLREEINLFLEGKTRGTKKLNYGLGRDKNGN